MNQHTTKPTAPQTAAHLVSRSSRFRRLSWVLAAAVFALVFITGPDLQPEEASAQEAGRFIVVLDVKGRKARKMREDVRQALSNSSHIVYSQQEFEQYAEDEGITEDNFWDIPAKMAQVSKAVGIDAVVLPELIREDRRYKVLVLVFEARTGEIMGEFTVELGRRNRFRDKHGEEILELANPIILETGQNLKPDTVAITVNSKPSGATLLREGVELGVTPTTADVEYAEVEEVWELTWNGEPAGVVRVNLAEDGSYDVTLAEEVVGEIADDDDDDEDEPSVGRRFDGHTGGGRPLFEITAGVELTTRNLDVTVVDGNELSYGSSVYPVFAGELAFFPFVLFSSNDYLGGLGVIAGGGYGSLDSRVQLVTGSEPFDPDGECSGPDDGGFITCPTTHSQFHFGAVYKLLLQDAPDGGLNADGMALGFDIAYDWLVFDIAENPTYEGHGYQGLRIGVTFDTPLVIEPLRLGARFEATPMLSFGDADMIEDWGEQASGWGVGGGLDISYDIWEGLIAGLDADIQWNSTSYDGTGCQDIDCTIPTGSEASDLFFQSAIKVGYRLQ